MPKLTKTIVENSSPKNKQYTVWCSDLKGFGVCINPSGSRSYVVDYRNTDGTRRRMTIGRHGPLTTEEARKMAITTLGSTFQGDDPQLERRTRRQSITVGELSIQYMELARKGLILGRGGKPKKQPSLDSDQSMINSHIIPLLGNKLVIDIKRTDVVKFIRDVMAGKSAKKREASTKKRGTIKVDGGTGSATRATASLGTILSYAVSEGIIEINPTFGVKKPAIGKRERRLNPDEYKSLGTALANAHAHEETRAWQGIAMMKMLVFTGCRLGEITNLKWSEVDLENRVLVLADTKTGKSVRPLSIPARAALEEITPTPDNDYVFAAPVLGNKPYAGFKRFYRRMFKEAGFDDVTPHVLRHSFASVGADIGFSDSTIGAIIGHTGGGITSRYTHRLDSVLVAAADKIAEEIERQMSFTGRP